VSAPGADGSARDEEPGTIVEATGDQLVVATGAGRLRLTEIQAEGKRPMNIREFLAGHRLAAGERFESNS
jgi:methionyl-tRNA formyltransferase